jgi:hypothetical protein
MGASYPKPDAQKVTRHAPAFGWRVLPAEGRKGAPPPLPTWRKWSTKTRAWWADLWSAPQAVAWDQTGRSLWTLAALFDSMAAGLVDVTKCSAEMRQHEDRHGLNPKAMLQLRWVIAEPEETPAAAAPRRSRSKATKGPALRIIGAAPSTTRRSR